MADRSKAELIAELARTRSQAAANAHGLGEDLQVGDKLKENITQHRGAWLSGAVIAGLAIAKLPPRTKRIMVTDRGAKVEKEIEKAGKAGILLGIAKVIFNFVRPFLMKWVTQRLGLGQPADVRRPYAAPRRAVVG